MKSVFLMLIASATGCATDPAQVDDSVVFGGLAYFVAKPIRDKYSDFLKENMHPDLVEHLRGVAQAVRDDPERKSSRAKVCERDAKGQGTRRAVADFERTTQAVWVRLYASSPQVLSSEQYQALIEAVDGFRRQMSYTDSTDPEQREQIVVMLCRG